MVMHGNFAPRFHRPTRDKMPVGGPMFWDGDDPANPDPVVKIRVVDVSVTQAAAGARASGHPDTEWKRPEDDDVTAFQRDQWYADLDVEGVFRVGPARAHADVVVTRADNSTAETVWDHDVAII